MGSLGTGSENNEKKLTLKEILGAGVRNDCTDYPGDMESHLSPGSLHQSAVWPQCLVSEKWTSTI